MELADQLHEEAMRRDANANLLEDASQAIRRLATALVDANDLCRSAYQVAERTGVNTNWNGLEACLSESLARQHAVMYPPNAPDQGRRANDSKQP